jgi:dTDP-4-amino-4,6-dideoxygalactose transaminase
MLRINQLKNFGFVDEVTVVAPGINGKMSEFNSALGLLQLKSLDDAIEKRQIIDAQYRQGLADIKGIRCLPDAGEKVANYSYFPILIEADYPISRDELYQKLKGQGIFSRRYFYPLISDFPMYRGMPSAHRDNLPVANDAAFKVLCLPIYPGLQKDELGRIVELIRIN